MSTAHPRSAVVVSTLAVVVPLALGVTAPAYASPPDGSAAAAPSSVTVIAAPVTSAAPAATAPDAPAVVVEVRDGALAVSAEQVREAIARELAAPAVPPSAAPPSARGTLSIALDAERRLVISYRDASGRELIRAIAVPSDPTAVVATIALIAGNLARNQVDELLVPASPPPAPPSPALPQPPPAPPRPVVVVAPRPALRPTPLDRRAAIEARRVMLGVEGYVGGERDGGPDVVVPSGLLLGIAVRRNWVIGINHVMFTPSRTATGSVFAVGGGPFVEFRGLWGTWLQPFVQVGVPMQYRWRRSGTPTETGSGIATYAGAGLRARIGDRFSLGLGLRVYVPVTPGGYAFGVRNVDQGSVVFTGGGEIGVHF